MGIFYAILSSNLNTNKSHLSILQVSGQPKLWKKKGNLLSENESERNNEWDFFLNILNNTYWWKKKSLFEL